MSKQHRCLCMSRDGQSAFVLLVQLVLPGMVHVKGFGYAARCYSGPTDCEIPCARPQVLKESALVEAFNLKGAIEYNMKNCEAAREAMADAPPRTEEELDPVRAACRSIQPLMSRISSVPVTCCIGCTAFLWCLGGAFHPANTLHQPYAGCLQHWSSFNDCSPVIKQCSMIVGMCHDGKSKLLSASKDASGGATASDAATCRSRYTTQRCSAWTSTQQAVSGSSVTCSRHPPSRPPPSVTC